jgi:hypothetical protein
VTVLDNGFTWNGYTFGSLSQVAKAITDTSWNGHRFFGLSSRKDQPTVARLSKRGRIVPSTAEPRAIVGVDRPKADNEAPK